MKRILLFLGVLFVGSNTQAQFSFTHGNHSLQLSGLISGYYNHRFLNPDVAGNYLNNNPSTGVLDYQKNTFAMNNLRMQFEGRIGNTWEYELQVDFSRLGQSQNIGEFPALTDGWIRYKGFPAFDITLGYQKLPYSRLSLTPFKKEVYWQRAEVVRGNIFSRRDAGVVLSKGFWGDRLRVQAGAFTGQGEYIMTAVTEGDNDPSGTLEYVGRIDFSWPRVYKYNEVLDTRVSNQPNFSLGLNARHVKRLRSLPGLADYDLKVVQGNRTAAGFDFVAEYQGFSALIESHLLTYRPEGADTARLRGRNTDYFRAGGIVAQLNYYAKPWNSSLSVRYDNFSPNDLIQDNLEQTLSLMYNYFFKDAQAVFRVHYFHRLDPDNSLLLRRDNQLRIGLILLF